MGLKEIMPRVIRYEQNAEIKRRGNTDYLKTDARTKDGWRAIRTFQHPYRGVETDGPREALLC